MGVATPRSSLGIFWVVGVATPRSSRVIFWVGGDQARGFVQKDSTKSNASPKPTKKPRTLTRRTNQLWKQRPWSRLCVVMFSCSIFFLLCVVLKFVRCCFFCLGFVFCVFTFCWAFVYVGSWLALGVDCLRSCCLLGVVGVRCVCVCCWFLLCVSFCCVFLFCVLVFGVCWFSLGVDFRWVLVVVVAVVILVVVVFFYVLCFVVAVVVAVVVLVVVIAN